MDTESLKWIMFCFSEYTGESIPTCEYTLLKHLLKEKAEKYLIV